MASHGFDYSKPKLLDMFPNPARPGLGVHFRLSSRRFPQSTPFGFSVRFRAFAVFPGVPLKA